MMLLGYCFFDFCMDNIPVYFLYISYVFCIFLHSSFSSDFYSDSIWERYIESVSIPMEIYSELIYLAFVWNLSGYVLYGLFFVYVYVESRFCVEIIRGVAVCSFLCDCEDISGSLRWL